MPQHPRQLASLTPLQQLRAGRLPRRLVQLFVGLSLYGASMALMIRGALGLDPWDVFHVGVSHHVPLSIGTIIVLVGVLVLLLWIPLRQWPGLGTVANAVWIGVATDITLALVPASDDLFVRFLEMSVGGVLLNGLAGALYIGAQLGPGPRDGLMTGIAGRTGWSLRLVRTGIEVTVLAIGWLLGGGVGLGTILYAVGIGPVVQHLLPYCIVPLHTAPSPTREVPGKGAETPTCG
ncbi:membrane protein [Mariniluteicoccus endophyticus]